MVTLRKRKTPPPAPVRPAKKQAAPKDQKPKGDKKGGALSKVAKAVTAKPAANGEAADPGPPKPGETIDLATFGGQVETHEGRETTLAQLVEQSKAGVVLFTYPKASTPGCTAQACLFRDSYEPLTATGLAIYGLSSDSPKANTTFRTKQNLPYALLCDPSQTLISAIGLKKVPKGTTRGVFAIDKSGKILVAEPGNPAGTVEAVKKLVGEEAAPDAGAAAKEEEKEKEDDKMAADTAGEVADTAAEVDKKAP